MIISLYALQETFPSLGRVWEVGSWWLVVGGGGG